MPPSSRSAADVMQESLRLLVAHDMDAYADLWAEDGVFELPFAPSDQTAHIRGREALRAYLAGYTDLLDVHAVDDVRMHEGRDRDHVVVEFEVTGVAAPTGRPYRLRYVAVVRTRDGEIVRYRDYWSPQAAAEALAGTDTSGAAFASGVAP